ncbi:MAG: YqeG family HAD IIIA-type phosphatase [Bacillota bacterium]
MFYFIKKYFQPDYHFNCMSEIDINLLKDSNIKGLIIDIDNTTMAYSSKELKVVIQDWISEIDNKNFEIVFVSNTIPERVEFVGDYFNKPAYGYAAKPFRFAFNKAINHLKLPNEKIAIIGDQIFTDILGGNLTGFMTILVEPIEKNDFFLTKFFRWFETLFYDRSKSLMQKE